MRAETVELSGLTPEAVRALLPAELPAETLETVHARTAGNPFYVVELGRLLAAGDAGRPRCACARSCARAWSALGPDTGAVLEAGAVAGRFTIADLVRACRRAPGRRWRRRSSAASRAGMVLPDVDAPGHFVFAHAIVRDAVREALPGPRRGALHEAVADALRVRRDAGADVSAARIAHHAIAAARIGADPQPAWEAALEAAREAAAALGHAEAARHYADALEAIALGAEAPAARAARDAARAGRGDVRGRRHRGRAPALRAGGRRGPARARRRGAGARRARLLAGATPYGARRLRGA